MLIHGLTNAGKTVLAIHKAPRPTLVLDCDNGLDSVFGTGDMEDVHVWVPESGTEYVRDDLDAFRNYVKAGKWLHHYKAIVVDNVTAGQKPVIKAVLADQIARAVAKARHDTNPGDTNIDINEYVPTRQGWGEIYRWMDEWIRDIRDAKRRGAHIIFTAGTSEWMDDAAGYSRLMPDLEGKERNQIATHMDAVGWLEADNDGRRLIMAPSGTFVTKLRLPVEQWGKVPSEIEDPDFDKMIKAVKVITRKGGGTSKKAASNSHKKRPSKKRSQK